MKKLILISALLLVCNSAHSQVAVFPRFDNGAPQNVIGLKYRAKILTNNSSSVKILFSSRRLWNPASPAQTYLLESNLYSHRWNYSDGLCNATSTGNGAISGTYLPATSSLFVSIPDYNGQKKIGAKSYQPSAFPRQSFDIDGIPNLLKIETMAQGNVTGLDMTIEHVRGELIPSWDRYGWKPCGQPLDGDTYRRWIAKIQAAGLTFQIDFAVPESGGKYISPSEILSFTSEFLEKSGAFRSYVWGAEYLSESTGTWTNIDKWVMTRRDNLASSLAWGVRIATYQGRPVMEFSNDNVNDYLKTPGLIFSISAQAPVLKDFSPKVKRAGWGINFQFIGSNFQPGSVLQFSSDGVNISEIPLNYVSPEFASFSYGGYVPAGYYYIRIRNPNGTMSNYSVFTVTP